MNPSDKVKVFTNIKTNEQMEIASVIYQDRNLDLPWNSDDPRRIALAAWGDFSPTKEAAVLGVVTDTFSGHPILVIQRWTLVEDLLDSPLPQ